jgi:hypothetical protein
MNPSSLDVDLPVVQRQKNIYKLFVSELYYDEGSPSTVEISFSARQQVTCS